MVRRVALTVAILAVLVCGDERRTMAAADQWPLFRGTGAGVVADDPALPETWGAGQNIAWKTAVPGMGWSSPVVWDDHIFITAAISSGKGVLLASIVSASAIS